MSFVHLHNHTHYSLLDGLAKVNEYVDLCKEFSLPAMAITDHGVMYGAIEFYQKFKAAGIKPIIGCEAYITGDVGVKDNSARYSHLVLLAKNEKGYKNLMQLTSIAHMEGFYYRPRFTKEILEKHKDGLICTSGCPAAEIPQFIIDGNYEEARKVNSVVCKYF